MKTVEELLRDADPLRHEQPRAGDRERARAAMLAAARASSATGRGSVGRRVALAVGVAALVGLAVAGSRMWSGSTVHAAAVRFEARLAETTPTLDLQPVRIAGTDRVLYLHREAIVTNDDVAAARVMPGEQPSTFNVAVTLTAAGGERMRAATAGHIGRPMALLIDGDVVMAPTVRAAMSTQVLITGNVTRAEADRIASGVMLR